MFHDARSLELKSEKLKWSCYNCKVDFDTREELDRHVMNYDCWKDIYKSNKCPMNNCKERFLTKKELKIHKVSVHSY
jgi:hypothetical protein